MITIAERVQRGAEFLDEHDPEWWRADVERAIDLDTLDLGNGSKCILGQRCPLEVQKIMAYRPGTAYTWWATILSGADEYDWQTADDWAAERGFQVSEFGDDYWADLTAEWRKVITERRAAS